MTLSLIGVQLVIFLTQVKSLFLNGHMYTSEWGLIPLELTRLQNLPASTEVPPLLSLFSCMFLHGGWMHFIGNMWYLWIFGDNVEERIGPSKYLLFYLFCGIAASLTHVFCNADSTLPMIGASGAISGVLGAYMVTYSKVRIKTLLIFIVFIHVIHIPAFYLIGFWFIRDLIGMSFESTQGIAFAAHVGGFIIGAIGFPFIKTQKN